MSSVRASAAALEIVKTILVPHRRAELRRTLRLSSLPAQSSTQNDFTLKLFYSYQADKRTKQAEPPSYKRVYNTKQENSQSYRLTINPSSVKWINTTIEEIKKTHKQTQKK